LGVWRQKEIGTTLGGPDCPGAPTPGSRKKENELVEWWKENEGPARHKGSDIRIKRGNGELRGGGRRMDFQELFACGNDHNNAKGRVRRYSRSARKSLKGKRNQLNA